MVIRMMIKRLFRMMTVSILLLCLFGTAVAENKNEEIPGWRITDSSEITEDALIHRRMAAFSSLLCGR